MIRPAIRAAISVYHDPTSLPRRAADPLPPGMTELLGLLNSGSAPAAADCEELGIETDELVAAARFYVSHVVCHDGADDYRLFGADTSTPMDRLRQHRRLLLRWIHPDASDGELNSSLFQRLNEAWHRLEKGEADHPIPDFLRCDRRGGRPATVPSVSRSGMAARRIPRGMARRMAAVAIALVVFATATSLFVEALASRRSCPTVLMFLPLCQAH